ncbi:MAG: vtpJ-therm [Alphaproteobacteria bacterium]|nr:vtpJ-therm [Alphaproteobacteria bacterium]
MRHLLLTAAMAACAAPEDVPDELTGPARLAADLGLDVHLGQAVAAEVDTEDGVTTTTFADDSGPLCLRGGPFRAATRPGPSDDLLIFLQGGGACWSDFCLAVNQAPPGMPGVDALLPDLEANPFRAMDVAYAPYCDASLFSGRADLDDDGDGTPDRFHRGLQNLSATLDLAVAAFPDPPRVVLAGSSGGGYGTILGALLVRRVFPDAELVVLADSGSGVARGAADPGFVRGLLEEQGSLGFVPPDCVGCIDDGHVTGLLHWTLERDPTLRIGLFSSWYDSIIGDVFLRVAPEAFRDELAAQTDALHAAFPDRYRRFLVDGRTHTTLLGDPTGIIGSDLGAVELPPGALDLRELDIGELDTTAVGDLAFSTWAQALVDGDLGVWVDTVEPAGAPPGDEEPP